MAECDCAECDLVREMYGSIEAWREMAQAGSEPEAGG